MTIIVDTNGTARFFTVRDALSAHLRQMSVTLPQPCNLNNAPQSAA